MSSRRALLDPTAIDEHALTLQRLTRPVKHADGVHDLLLSLGDLSRAEITVRLADPSSANAWLTDLVRARRIFEAHIGGEPRYVAIEDAGKLRDALGVVPPRGTPKAFLERGADPMADLVARYARTHVPFPLSDVVARFGASRASVEIAVRGLLTRGKLEEG